MMDERELEQLEALIERISTKIARNLGEEVAGALSRSEKSSSSQPTPQDSGSRSGSSTLDVAPFSPRQLFDSQLINERLTRHRERRDAADGFLPAFYGGQVTWQNIAQGTTDIGNAMSGRFSSARHRMMLENEDDYGPASLTDVYQLMNNQRPSFSTRAGSALGAFGKGISSASSYVEDNAQMIETFRHVLQRGRHRSNQVEELGMSLGTSPGQGFGSQVGPVRLPFINPAARTGIGATVDSFFSAAMAPGLSVEQDMALKTSLADLGFFDGQQDTQKLLGSADGGTRSGLRELFQYDPQAAELMLPSIVEAARNGGVELENFITSLKDVRSSAEAANVGLEDYISQIQTSGEIAKSSGGTLALGMQRGNAFSQATGLPPAVGNDLSQSSVVQGRISGLAGIPTYAQGALGAYGGELTTQAMLDIVSTVPEMEGIPGVPGSAGNMRAAMIQQILGQDVNPEYIKKFFNPTFANNAKKIGAITTALNSSPKGFGPQSIKAAKDIRKAVRNAKNPQGDPLFTKEEIQNVMSAGGYRKGAVNDIGFDAQGNPVFTKEFIDEESSSGAGADRDALVKWMEENGIDRDEGMSDEDYLKKNFNRKMKKAYFADRTKQAGQEIMKSYEERKKEDRNNQVQIGFTPQAMQWLQEVTPGQRNRNARNAGGPSTASTRNGAARYTGGSGG